MVTHIPSSPSSSAASHTRNGYERYSSVSSSHRHDRSQSTRSRQSTSRSARTPTSSYTVTTYRPTRSRASSPTSHHGASDSESASFVSSHTSYTSSASTAANQSSSRRHRTQRNRTTHIDPSSITQNAFPWFSDGDVEIVLRDEDGSKASEKRFRLHGIVLAQGSSFFARALGFDNALQPTSQNSSRRPSYTNDSSRSSTGSTAPTRYNLEWTHQDDEVPVLVRVRSGQETPASSNAFRQAQRPSFSTRSHASNHDATSSAFCQGNRMTRIANCDSEDVLLAYENLLLILYNFSPRLDSQNIANAYLQCKLLLNLACYYHALTAVGPRVDHHLLLFQGRLWRQIAKYPPSYLKLGYLAHSRAIFSEALVHVVGQWPIGSRQLRAGAIDPRVLGLIRSKLDDANAAKARADLSLFRLSLSSNPSWLDWLAQSLFRQWVAEHTGDDASAAMLTKTYRLLARGGNSYLDSEECKRFLKHHHPQGYYSRENLRRLERRVDELKSSACEIVRPLTRNHGQSHSLREGDPDRYSLDYVPFPRVRVEDLDFIWSDDSC